MKKTMETSKKLAWVSGVCFVVILLYSMFMFTYSVINETLCDFAILITLITTSGAVFGTTTAFYYNKSRRENTVKLQRSFLKSKYLILKDINALDEYRIKSEIETELSKIDCGLEEEMNVADQEVTYNNYG